MASSIFSNGNKPVGHNGRNPFDQSAAHALVMRPGITRAVVFQPTVPNASYEIDAASIVRTDALQQAAFVRGRQELDFFFVPYRQLYSNFDTVVFGRGDNHSPLNDELSATELPAVHLSNLIHYACFVYVAGTSWMKYCKARNEVNLQVWQEICDAWFTRFVEDEYHTTQEMQDYLFRISFFDNASLYSLDPSQELFGPNDLHPIGASMLQLLSTFRYGDYQTYCDCFLNSQTINWSQPTTIVNAISEVAYAVNSLCNSQRIVNKTVSLMHCAAYQKIWKDVYRDSIVDDSSLYTQACTVDSLALRPYFDYTPVALMQEFLTNVDACLTNSIAYTFLRPRLRTYKKDLNTGLWPSTQFGDVATVQRNSVYSIFQSMGVPDTGGNASFRSSGAYAIKFTLALQKYRESLMRAGNKTKDLLMAEFGVKSRYVDDNYVHPIGSFGGSFDINKVACTADSGDYQVGDLAANMVSSLQGDILKFTCNDYGVIVGVLTFMPEVYNAAFGISRHNLKFSQFDFYHSDFENLGLVPVGSSEFDVISPTLSSENEDILGYAARYYEYKTNQDLCHDSFCPAPFIPEDLIVGSREAYYAGGVDSNYINTRNVRQALSTLKDRSYIFPDCMDSIFKNLDDGTPENSHFKVAIAAAINAVQPMSVTGMM